jgi:bacterioferritin-associated ferredoxin
MYVCLCNGITENQIRDAVREGIGSLLELRLRLGVASSCGKCGECAQQVLSETLASEEFCQSLNAA